jgi:hypothetical protein
VRGAASTQQFILDELAARLAKARSAGVDAIEFDNVDAYQNKTGLTISAATQEQFDAAIANLAHTAGFAAGLKNDLGQASDLQPYFDFAINEQCWQFRECNFPAPGLQAWPPAGKAVFNVEYKRCQTSRPFPLQADRHLPQGPPGGRGPSGLLAAEPPARCAGR